MLVGLDALLQHLHAIYLGCIAMADGGVSMKLTAADVGCRTGSIGHFHHLQHAVAGQELAALHQRHGM